MSETECPTCGRSDFKNRIGMKNHHKIAHDESIAGKLAQCETCGEAFRYNEKNRKGRFCSNKCSAKDENIGFNEGEDNHKYTPKIETKCRVCSVVFEQYPSDGKKYCSRECYGEWLSDNNTGRNHPRFTESEEVECDSCGKVMELKLYDISAHNFCCRSCLGRWLSEHNSGEDSVHWKGGVLHYYGRSWMEQRRKVLERDSYTCQHPECDEDIDSLSREPDVHHITSFREFGVEKHEEANRLENLITLCRKHHLHVEHRNIDCPQPKVVA